MSQLLRTETVTVSIDYSQFYICDSGFQLGEEVPAPPTFHDSLGVGNGALSVPSTIQSHQAVVHVELWSSAPLVTEGGEFTVGEADLECRGSVGDYPQGAVVVFSLMGSEHAPMPLDEPGVHRVRVQRNPENARPDWERNWERRRDGYEVYRVQLWRPSQ
ncbi:hypothetical protein [Streptomyces sp. NPDC048508]|uniref:hypothetical protein n=1 Tax=Streptomyces sp. NPDC048508 TaxID=3365561 RepID=UPI0037224976